MTIKNNKVLFALLLTLAITAQAEESTVKVLVLDPGIKTSDLETDEIHPTRLSTTKSPAANLRNKVFEKNGITPFVKSFSDVKKNQLYSFAGSAPVDRLVELYPEIPREKLTALRVSILKSKGNQK